MDANNIFSGERNYGTAVDMWGVGCIMAEMWTRTPIMHGRTEQNQLYLITKLCGSITPDIWPGVEKLELYGKMKLPHGCPRIVVSRLKYYVKNALACDLIDKLLCLNPSNRIEADIALDHNFFWTDPMPRSLENMLSTHEKSMFQYSGSQKIRTENQISHHNDESFKDLVY